MQATDFKKLFKKYPHSDWVIDEETSLPVSLLNKDYVGLICKKCGNRKKHSVGNIKHTLLKNIAHCRCTRCLTETERKRTSENVVKRVKDRINSIPDFPWMLDESLLIPNRRYDSKSLLPLLCRTCNTPAEHSSSNIQTCIQRPGHIRCQECKIRSVWKKKTASRTKGEFELDVNKTSDGFKIMHQKCGNYYYSSNPNLVHRYSCFFCSSNKVAITKMRDLEQISAYFKVKTRGELKFHNFDFDSRTFTVSCIEHPECGTYLLAWKSFLHSDRNGRTYCCNLCRKQRLRSTTSDEYNAKIKDLALTVDDNIDGKLNLSEKLLHHCVANSHHPAFYASPIEVIYKNKRCSYCSSSTSYHKDFDFIRNYVEMDEDRFFTHSGKRFKLLSSKDEIDNQIKPFKHLASVKIRLKELTCALHDEYEISWGSFYYRHMACGKCSKESNVSYAHNYYQALLEYFKQEYIPEYPVKIDDKTTYRIDFKLVTKPNFLEIDSTLHVGNGWDKKNRESYMLRDRQKDLKFKGNIERIKLYDDQHRALPTKIQLRVIEDAFANRAANNGIHITRNEIEEAKKDDQFFRNSRITNIAKKLHYYHGNHIEFKDKGHVGILETRRTNETEFHCTVNQESFRRNIISVFRMHFICPVCSQKIHTGKQDSYLFGEGKINIIRELVESKFNGKFDLQYWQTNQPAFFFLTVVFPVWDSHRKREIYLPLRDLLSFPAKVLEKKIACGRYNDYRTNKYHREIAAPSSRVARYALVSTANIGRDNRLLYNKRTTHLFNQYHIKAKFINRCMKEDADADYIGKLIAENESNFKIFIHKNPLEAKRKLAVYDRKIIPFFTKQKMYKLHTPRKKYVCSKQLLLIKDLRCGHLFYSSWNWITVRMNKGAHPIQCQRKDCFHRYYLTTNPEPRKIPQEDILQMFNDLFHGQYYPAFPNQKIMVKPPIHIIHLPSGRHFTASVDNFKRGKFRCEFKNLNMKELCMRFPTWSKK